VGLLVVVAMGLVAKSLWPMLSRGSRSAPAPSVPARPAPAKAPAAKPAAVEAQKRTAEAPAPPSPAPASEIDWARVQTNTLRWVESPRRDPFQVRDWPGHLTGTNQPASDFLTLNGIWRQTGSALAVINSTVVGEGDALLQFKIQSIEPDGVWVYGPAGVELLSFKSFVSEDDETEPGATGKNPPEPKQGVAPPIR
jgi:hypothetical protein